MNTQKVVIRMAFLVLMKMYIFPKFYKMTAKTAFFEIILNVHATRRENADENWNHISFITWPVSKNP